MRFISLLAALGCVASLAGCGDKTKTVTQTTTAPAPAVSTPKDTTAADATADTGIDSGAAKTPEAAAVKTSLERAGWRVTEVESSGDPTPDGAFETSSNGANFTVYVYASAADANRSAKDFAPVEKTNPDQLDVKVKGPRVYVATIEEPARVPEAKFRQFVASGEAAQ